MRFNNQKGNIIIEFLIYILICVIVLNSIISFFQIYRTKNEMFKLANFMAFSIAQDSSKERIFLSSDYLEFIVSSSKISFDKISIKCDQSICEPKSRNIQVDLVSSFDFLNINIPLLTSSSYEMSKFLSAN